MDKTVVDIILARIDKMEGKIDQLLASHWQRVGVSIAASFLFTIVFGLIVALIERH